MKTKELIKRLQECDPGGESEVVVGNHPIYVVQLDPGYYDGAYQVLIQDPDNKYYNVCGAKYTTKGTKVVIKTLSIESVFSDVSDLPVKYDIPNKNSCSFYKSIVEGWRRESVNIDLEIYEDPFFASDKSSIKKNIDRGQEYLKGGEDRSEEELKRLIRKKRVELGGKDEDLDLDP